MLRPCWDAPKSAPDLLKLFQDYEPDHGIDSLLSRIDWTPVTRGQIYWSVLGRWPEFDPRLAQADYNPREAFLIALQSSEFRENIRAIIANALPNHRRWIFVHIPKCAGTDLVAHLRQRSILLHTSLESETWTPQQDFLTGLRGIAADANHIDTLFLSGHQTLGWVLRQSLHRFGDRLFTIIRDPAAILISSVNYIVSRLVDDPSGSAVDTRDWLDAIGRSTVAAIEPAELARMVLRHGWLIRPNTMCNYLGAGDAASSLANLRSCDIEITDASQYNLWLRQSWGIESPTRLNASTPFMTLDDLAGADSDHVRRVTAEDQRLYDTISANLDADGGCSIRGWQIGAQRH